MLWQRNDGTAICGELFTVEQRQRDRLDGGEGFMGSKRRVVADLNG